MLQQLKYLSLLKYFILPLIENIYLELLNQLIFQKRVKYYYINFTLIILYLNMYSNYMFKQFSLLIEIKKIASIIDNCSCTTTLNFFKSKRIKNQSTII